MGDSITKQIQPAQFRAAFNASTWNPEKRTIELVWTTGAPVLRWGWDGQYNEELSLASGAVRLERLNSGAPLLNTHGQWELADIIGVVEKAWIEGGEGRAIVRLSDRDDETKAIAHDIASGIIRNVSVGYRVHKLTLVSGGEDQIPTYRAEDWEPFELSMVPIGADAGAGTRAAASQTNVCQIIGARSVKPADNSTQGKTMDPITTPVDGERAGAAVPAAPAVPAPAASPEAIAKAERQRVQDIHQAVRAAGLDLSFADSHVESGASADEVRKLVIAELAKRQQTPAAPVATGGLGLVGDEGEKEFRAIEGAIEARVLGTKLEGKAKEYRSATLLDFAKRSLELNGIRIADMSRDEIAMRALAMKRDLGGLQGTGDLAGVLANVANKSLLKAYEVAPRSYTKFARKASAPDFKTLSRVNLGGFPTLAKVNEHGEFLRGVLADSKETYALETYGKIIGLTRKAIINDDLSSLARMPQMAANAAANLEGNTVYALLAANAAMADGVAFFHSSHANLGSAGAPSTTTLNTGMKAIGTQTGPDGAYLNLVPKYLICGFNYKTTAEQLVYGQLFASSSSSIVTDAMRQLIVVVDARITDNTWYLACDPSQIDGVEYAYLDGNEGPTLETRNGFDVDGVEFKVKLDFGAGLVEHRGWYKFPA